LSANALLKRELDISHEQSQRQAQQLRWNAIAAVSAVLVIALLIYFLVTNLRFRKQLVRLASLDGLTGCRTAAHRDSRPKRWRTRRPLRSR